ncbi:MAG: SsrA-binding protein [Rickettsiales bacterium]|nr:SsrA-binding protein [Rickettsiales bacterium]|tara:strand:+ start:381 stop:845 length:465 start_codon:yes stop_codon:yes gene_type:complete
MAERTRISVAVNRKARHEYFIEDTYEAGLVLQGTEVKSLRQGNANIRDAYAYEKDSEIWLNNCYIAEFTHGNRFNHAPLRDRKLLLKGKEIRKLIGALKTKGTTLIPLELYFNERGIAKISVGLATGKKKYEKREAIKERDWKREQSRILKEHG